MTTRPRRNCPHCGREVALTAAGGIGWHSDPTGTSAGHWCDGYGQPAEAVADAELKRLAELVERYPDEARKLITGLP